MGGYASRPYTMRYRQSDLYGPSLRDLSPLKVALEQLLAGQVSLPPPTLFGHHNISSIRQRDLCVT